MKYMLENLQGSSGVLTIRAKNHSGANGALGSNLWDILPFGGKDAFSNIYFYASVKAMAQLEKIFGNTAESDRLVALSKKIKTEFNNTFWDESKGRYIGCVDLKGKKHDYGFVFVNLEALYYNLGDSIKARKIYKWLARESTSSGTADALTRWSFAPRTTTIENNDWHNGFFWSKDWTFDKQLQNGGAWIYMSFYDIAVRSRYLSAASGYNRLIRILKRYSRKDRLMGGSPMIEGENVQGGENGAGAVGAGYNEFPEAGLVPCSFLYGILGIEPDAFGLVIKPKIPSSMGFGSVFNLDYRKCKMNIRVTQSDVTIECTDNPGVKFMLGNRRLAGTFRVSVPYSGNEPVILRAL